MQLFLCFAYANQRKMTMKTKHKHADVMLEYAKDARESDTPWINWEYMHEISNGWQPLSYNPTWNHTVIYRRKVKTIRIGEYDVPEPLRVKPNIKEKYYFVTFKVEDNVHSYFWYNNNVDNQLLSNGVVHLTREAAELHAKALISLTKP